MQCVQALVMDKSAGEVGEAARANAGIERTGPNGRTGPWRGFGQEHSTPIGSASGISRRSAQMQRARRRARDWRGRHEPALAAVRAA